MSSQNPQKKKRSIPNKSLVYRGQQINYRTIYDIKRQLGVTKDQAKKIRDKYGKTVRVKGRNIKYNKPGDLALKTKISQKNATNVINNQNSGVRILYDNQKKEVGKYNIRDKPLLFRKFGIKRVPTNAYVSRGAKIIDKKTKESFDVTEGLGPDVEVRLTIDTVIKVMFYDVGVDPNAQKWDSDDWDITRYKTFRIFEKVKDIETELNRLVLQYISGMGHVIGYQFRYLIKDRYSKNTFTIENNVMRESTPLRIYGMDIEIPDNGSCVSNLLKTKYKKISAKKIDSLFENGADVNTLINEFSKKYKIKTIIYDINLKEIASYIPLKPSRYPALLAINYNNHIYEIDNSLLKKKSYKEYENVCITKNINIRLKKLLHENILPTEIKMNDSKVYSFIHDKIKYIENPEYKKCLEILKMFGLDDKIYDSVKLKHLGSIIEKLYSNNKPAESFFPIANRFIKGGFNYINKDLLNEKKTTIDKNKQYPSCLKNLRFLITLDYRTSEIIEEVDENNIIDYYLYICKPELSSILMPDTNLYSGEFVKYCQKEGLKFKILSGITAHKTYNYFYDMINECYEKLDNDDFKIIFNIMIGSMEMTVRHKQVQIFDRICNNEEVNCVSGHKKQINNKYTINYNYKDSLHIYNKKPIAMQIKDASRKLVYEQMKKLNLNDHEIVQIKTDAITFINKKTNVEQYISNGLDGWKYEDFKPISKTTEYYDVDWDFYCNNENDNIIYDCYAGCGKTYDIINNLTPKLNNYIVLAPTHGALLDHREHNLKTCNIMQKYCFSNTIPDEDIIIIDEHGLMDKSCHDFIYKCFFLNKTIISYGDFKQLPPPFDEKRDKKHYLNMIFGNTRIMSTNFRNNFEKEYYDKLISGELDGLKEVIKYSTESYKDADTIICYRIDTCKKYNELMLKHKNMTMHSVGCFVICKSNKLLKTTGIYNGFMGYVTEVNIKEKYIMIDDIKVTPLQFNSYFKPAFARTTYNVQGRSLDNYYYPPEDYSMVTPEVAYVVVSRLKQEKEQEEE